MQNLQFAAIGTDFLQEAGILAQPETVDAFQAFCHLDKQLTLFRGDERQVLDRLVFADGIAPVHRNRSGNGQNILVDLIGAPPFLNLFSGAEIGPVRVVQTTIRQHKGRNRLLKTRRILQCNIALHHDQAFIGIILLENALHIEGRDFEIVLGSGQGQGRFGWTLARFAADIGNNSSLDFQGNFTRIVGNAQRDGLEIGDEGILLIVGQFIGDGLLELLGRQLPQPYRCFCQQQLALRRKAEIQRGRSPFYPGIAGIVIQPEISDGTGHGRERDRFTELRLGEREFGKDRPVDGHLIRHPGLQCTQRIRRKLHIVVAFLFAIGPKTFRRWLNG